MESQFPSCFIGIEELVSRKEMIIRLAQVKVTSIWYTRIQ